MKHTEAVLLIDGDVLLFQACSASCEEVVWEPDVISMTLSVSDAARYIKTKIKNIKEFLYPTPVVPVFCFGDAKRHYFRKDLSSSYKAHRIDKPLLGRKIMREWCEDNYRTHAFPKVEGDDTVGVLASRLQKKGLTVFTWSIDKDFLQIPAGFVRELDDGTLQLFNVTPESAERFHRFQTLVGDRSDGYPGCPGLGPKRAGDHIEAWTDVAACFDDYDEFLLQARLAFILDDDHYDTETHEVKLWQPPS